MSTLNTQQLKDADFDDIIDLDFNAIEDLPEYITPVSGYATLSITNIESVETNRDEGHRGIRFTLSIESYQEISEPALIEKGIATDETGGVFTITYSQGAGIQRLKGDWKGVAEVVEAKTPKELVQRVANGKIQAEIVLRPQTKVDENKVKTTRYFPSLRNITLASA